MNKTDRQRQLHICCYASVYNVYTVRICEYNTHAWCMAKIWISARILCFIAFCTRLKRNPTLGRVAWMFSVCFFFLLLLVSSFDRERRRRQWYCIRYAAPRRRRESSKENACVRCGLADTDDSIECGLLKCTFNIINVCVFGRLVGIVRDQSCDWSSFQSNNNLD